MVFGIDAIPPIRFAPTLLTETEQQLTAVNALAWVSYAVSSRIDLVLAAGAAFNRTSVEQRIRFETLPIYRDFLRGCRSTCSRHPRAS